MAAPDQSSWETIWLGDEDTTEDEGWLPCQWDATYNELSVFEGKVTFGAITNDSDDIVSSYVISDLSGGGQIDMMTGADQTRFRHGIIDARSPGTITLPQYVQDTGVPSGATGTTYPAYFIGDVVFGIWGTKVYPWDEDTDTWGAGVTILEPSAKPTMFDGKVFIPNGTSGYTRLTGSTPTQNQYAGVNTPALSTDTDSPNVIDFEVWDQKLWAITPSGAVAYSLTGDDDSWDWSHSYNTSEARWIGFDDSRPPKKLFTYSDNNGDPLLHAATTRAVYRFDATLQRWEPTNIQFAPHPNFASAVAVWRPGEDLHIGMGLEKITYTAANVIVPDQGLSRNDGMPFSNLGTISDLEPETSRLFACVSGSEYGFTELAYDTSFAATSGPRQIAVDPSNGNLFVPCGSVIKKFSSTGTLLATSTSVTGVTLHGVCVVSGSTVYFTGSNGTDMRVYSATNALGSVTFLKTLTGYTVGGPMSLGPGLFVYIGGSDGTIHRMSTATGTWSTLATVLGTLAGLATDGTYLYAAESSLNRVSKLTTSGTSVSTFSLTTPGGIAYDATSDTLWVINSTTKFVHTFSTIGTPLRQLSVDRSPTSSVQYPAVSTDGSVVYVNRYDEDEVAIFDVTDSTHEFPAVPSIHDWNGLGWFGSWELTDSPDEQLTWGCIQSTSHPTDGYAYWFGCTDGKLRRIPLRRTFHNPRAGWQAGYDRFAETGYLLTSRFNALMAGFYKKAHRLVVYMDNATPTEKVTVKYRVDIEDDNWITLGEVTSTGRTILPFGEDASGFSWGKRFNWIQFQFDFERGDDEYQTPVLQAAVLNYSKVPQQARSFTFRIPYPKRQWLQKTGKEIETHLSNMLAASSLIKLVHRDRTYRGTVAAVAGTTSLGKNDAGGATLNFLEIRVAD